MERLTLLILEENNEVLLLCGGLLLHVNRKPVAEVSVEGERALQSSSLIINKRGFLCSALWPPLHLGEAQIISILDVN